MRYDIVGCGEVATTSHAPVLNRLKSEGRLVVRACIDTSHDRASQLAKRLRAVPAISIGEVGAAGADAALVAVAPALHAELAMPYLTAGCTVLMEKPFVTTPAEAEKLLSVAKASGARILVGHMRRLYPSTQIAREVVRSGLLGEIIAVDAREGARWEWPAASNYVVTSASGGVLYDTGSHVLDTLLFLLGLDFAEVSPRVALQSVSRDRSTEPSHDVSAQFRLQTAEIDLPVDFRVTRTESIPSSVIVHGSRASLAVAPGFGQQPTLLAGERALRVDMQLPISRPESLLGCFRLEHEAVISPASQPDIAELLDGSRFVTLTGLLDMLAHS